VIGDHECEFLRFNMCLLGTKRRRRLLLLNNCMISEEFKVVVCDSLSLSHSINIFERVLRFPTSLRIGTSNIPKTDFNFLPSLCEINFQTFSILLLKLDQQKWDTYNKF